MAHTTTFRETGPRAAPDSSTVANKSVANNRPSAHEARGKGSKQLRCLTNVVGPTAARSDQKPTLDRGRASSELTWGHASEVTPVFFVSGIWILWLLEASPAFDMLVTPLA